MKSVKIGAVTIGNGAPVAIQSMTNVPTSDPEAAVRQVNQLAEAGCDIAVSYTHLTLPTRSAV